MNILLFLLLMQQFFYKASALLCYQCVSTHPGCGKDFKWIWYKTISCPDEDDVCVKITEKKDGNEIITRDCLSSVRAIRTDIPGDRYEGCRASSYDPKLANYVNNSIKQLDIKRDYYDQTIYCFCYFDNWCNGAFAQLPSFRTVFAAVIVPLLVFAVRDHF